MARWRKIREAYAEIKSADPNTALTESAIRRMVQRGDIPSHRIGTHYLINLDDLDALCTPQPQDTATGTGVIRRLPTRI